MIHLKGEGKHSGIAIATAAVIDFKEGPSSLPYSILQRAAESVKRNLQAVDQPEVVMVSEQLVFGAMLKIPGIQKCALIAESEENAEGLPINIPCVIGVTGAMESITNEAIVIVDGHTGDVFVDPDVRTLVWYQNEIEERQRKARVYLDSAHLPAKTLDGRMIRIAARVRNIEELQTAVDKGADCINAEVSFNGNESEDFINSLMGTTAGNPITLIMDDFASPFLQFVLELSLPGQLTFAFPASSLNQEKERILEMIEMLQPTEPGDDLPQPRFAVLASSSSDTYQAGSTGSSVILKRPDAEVEGAVRKWISDHGHERLTVVLGDSLDMLPAVIHAGATTVEIVPELVEEAKNRIREMNSIVRIP